MMTTRENVMLPSSRQLLAEIREQLQRVHFAARGIVWPDDRDVPLSVTDQLHAIRLLAEQLDARLKA